jgi:hypothetical protein
MKNMSKEQRAKGKIDMLSRIREAKARFGSDLLSHEDIHGIGIGYKETKGKKTGELALVVHVYKKLPRNKLKKSRIIPSRLTFYSRREGAEVTVPIDVREAIPPVPEIECGKCDEDLEARVRPVPGGYSIGVPGVGGGTLGGWVWDRIDERFVLISNEHVLGSNAGDHVLQQSHTDGGVDPADHFANVVRSGTLDVAIAAPIDSDDVELEIICSGPAVYEIADASVDMEIEKVGQTTGLTCGIVTLIDYVSNHYGSKNDLWIDGNGTDFSQSGDSGSLYVEKENPNEYGWKRIVGIHWGGSGNDGVGHPIGAVFNDLSLSGCCTGIIQALIESILSAEAEEEHEGISARRAFLQPKTKKFYHGFARDFEDRILPYPVGKMVSDIMHKNRVEIVRLLLDRDGWRATVAALTPILRGCVTTDDVLAHRISKKDVENFSRLVKVAQRVRPNMKDALAVLEKHMSRAIGKNLQSILFGETEKPKLLKS